MAARIDDPARVAPLLAHVRWIGGGTGAGKSTLARVLAQRHGLHVYDGDAGERSYVADVTPAHQPYMCAWLTLTPRQRLGLTPEETFRSMSSLHGETIGFVVRDLLELAGDRPVLVDDFRTLPDQVAPLMSRPDQAVFLVPTPEFRENALRRRFADRARARANWGDVDHERALAHRLARDALWDAEVRRQAARTGLTLITVDGGLDVDDLALVLARRFALGTTTALG